MLYPFLQVFDLFSDCIGPSLWMLAPRPPSRKVDKEAEQRGWADEEVSGWEYTWRGGLQG